MDEDAITFGRRPDPLDGVTLREIFDASYRTLVVQLYGVTGSLDEAEDLAAGASCATDAGPRSGSCRRQIRRGSRTTWS